MADETFRLARIAFNAGLDLRREGSAELDLCSVAAGRAGLYFEMQVSLWDYAAGALLVREAGGVCQDIRGAELPFDGSKPTILAGGSHAVMDFLKLTEGGKRFLFSQSAALRYCSRPNLIPSNTRLKAMAAYAEPGTVICRRAADRRPRQARQELRFPVGRHISLDAARPRCGHAAPA